MFVGFLFNNHAQPASGPVKKLVFCGYKYKDTALLRRQFEPQLDFFKINNGDTIIDVGTSSGAYIGALNVIAPFTNVHFILVDIDPACLSAEKVKNMWQYYQSLRGSDFLNSYSMVLNTPDSLFLPTNRFRKLWIFNTLHEIADKKNMVRQMAEVLQAGGEVVVAELTATAKYTIHTGCDKPLMTLEEMETIFGQAGFRLAQKANLQPISKQREKHPYHFLRFIKM